jgi:hypothetical protein
MQSSRSPSRTDCRMKQKRSQKVEGMNPSDCATVHNLEIHSFKSLSFGLSNESRIEKNVVKVFHGIYTATTRDH